MILFFDTETTGKADMRSSPDAAHQPRIVQLAALLTDDKGEEKASINLIIKPDGFTIPVEASAIHGITTEIALLFGVEEIAALHVFDQLLMRSRLAVAHNIDFDGFMLSRKSRIRQERLFRSWFCTMKATTDVCQLPGPYGFKWPKLQEAHQHCFGKPFDGAHDALADVRACKAVYFWLLANARPTDEVAA
jgi:DNA polymerase-3 subunit epsilon